MDFDDIINFDLDKEFQIDLEEVVEPPKRNCTTCVHMLEPCGVMCLFAGCPWLHAGAKCGAYPQVGTRRALYNLRASQKDPENTDLDCPEWKPEEG